MQGDIFATKGVEYLIVVGYLLLLVGLAWGFGVPKLARAFALRSRGTTRIPAAWFTVAEGYGYHQGHSWAGPADGEVVRVGMDDFAAKVLGDPEAIDLPAVGEGMRQGGRAWTVRAGGRELPMVSPVDGEVVGVNPALAVAPGLAADDPYGEGWLVQVRVNGRGAWRRNLLSGDLAALWMRHTAERLRGLQSGGLELGAVMADGGSPVRGFARALGPEECDAIARELFLVG